MFMSYCKVDIRLKKNINKKIFTFIYIILRNDIVCLIILKTRVLYILVKAILHYQQTTQAYQQNILFF